MMTLSLSAARTEYYVGPQRPGRRSCSTDRVEASVLRGADALRGIEEVGSDRKTEAAAAASLWDGSFVIWFQHKSLGVAADSTGSLDALAERLVPLEGVRAVIEGHVDGREERSVERAIELGERRAEMVRRALTARGIAADRLKTVSYGRETPVCLDDTEECSAENCRVEVVLSRR